MDKKERNESLNDRNWQILFDKFEIPRRVEAEGVFTIPAKEIGVFREPRLMTKFDHAVNLPRPFLEHGLAILPMTRGQYLISHFDAYHELEETEKHIHRFSLPGHIQSLDCSHIPSEAIALNCAAAAGVIANFLGERQGHAQMYPTVSGRMGSGDFSFMIRDAKTGSGHRVQVSHAQIEIDAAYEGLSCLALIEAKMDISKDFLIRQLYYPFRVWEKRVTKPVRPVFMIYSNGIYRFYEYAFTVTDGYNSLKLVRQRNYSVEDTSISVSDIQAVLCKSIPVMEPDIPFPQADSFERVINLCELLNENEMSRAEVTARYDFDERQTNYYTDAARYLGLLEKQTKDGTVSYKISKGGVRTLQLPYKQRQLEFCRRILSHRAFRQSLTLYFQRGTMPSKGGIIEIMKQSGLHHVRSEETFARRASTIRGWLNWIVSLINE